MPQVVRDSICSNLFDLDRNVPNAPQGNRYYSIRACPLIFYAETRGLTGLDQACCPWLMFSFDQHIDIIWIMAHDNIYDEALRMLVLQNELESSDVKDLYIFLRHLDARHPMGHTWLRRIRINDPASLYTKYALIELRRFSSIRTIEIGYCRTCRELRTLGTRVAAIRRRWTALPPHNNRPKFADEISFWEAQRPGFHRQANLNGCRACWNIKNRWHFPPFQLAECRLRSYYMNGRQSLIDFGNSIGQVVRFSD